MDEGMFSQSRWLHLVVINECFKNVYELLNVRAVKISLQYQMQKFQFIGYSVFALTSRDTPDPISRRHVGGQAIPHTDLVTVQAAKIKCHQWTSSFAFFQRGFLTQIMMTQNLASSFYSIWSLETHLNKTAALIIFVIIRVNSEVWHGLPSLLCSMCCLLLFV